MVAMTALYAWWRKALEGVSVYSPKDQDLGGVDSIFLVVLLTLVWFSVSTSIPTDQVVVRMFMQDVFETRT